MATFTISILLIFSITTIFYTQIIEAKRKFDIGVFYGYNGDNLPRSMKVLKLYKKYGIGKIRLFEPHASMLHALRGSGIELALGVVNQDIPTLAGSEAAAEQWFETNVQPYVGNVSIPYIAMGNEVVPGQFSESILPAMQNLQNVLDKHDMQSTRVSTVVHMGILASTYPPSSTTFKDEAKPFMIQIIQYLSSKGSPLLINVYPYFAYASNLGQVHLDYTLFTATEPVIHDGDLSYNNLFDAMVDGFFWAMEKAGFGDVNVVVTESGWPHGGNGENTTPELAETYNKNFMQHILSHAGTPKKPGGASILSGYVFSFIDENRKPEGVEQNCGMLQHTLNPNYNIFT